MTEEEQAPLNATVVARADLNPALSIVRIAPDDGPVPAFVPGQFTMLGLPDADRPGRHKKRAYSIASDPDDREAMEFYVQLVKGGDFTTRLWTLEEGDRLWLSDKPAGHFTLDAIPEGREIVMVASGTGLAPFVSMVRHHPDAGRWRRFVIVHTVRRAEDLGYREELERAAAASDAIVYLPTVTREPEESDWAGARGRVQQLIAEGGEYSQRVGVLDPAHCHVMLCGNPEMIMAVHEQLEGLGFELHTKDRPGNIHYERYW